MMYTRSQNYTNMVVGRHGIQTFEVMVVVLLLLLLLFDFLPPQIHISYYFWISGLSNILKVLVIVFAKDRSQA